MSPMKNIPLALKRSSIHGHGIFPKVPVKKDQYIATLKGSKVIYKSSVHGQSNRYENWIGIGHNTWIDPIDEFQYLNHSCKPSAGLMGTHSLKLYALRDIGVDEEVTIDYSITEEDPDFCFENNEDAHEGYRRFIGPIQSLSRETYAKYLPYIPAHFRKVYENAIQSS